MHLSSVGNDFLGWIYVICSLFLLLNDKFLPRIRFSCSSKLIRRSSKTWISLLLVFSLHAWCANQKYSLLNHVYWCIDNKCTGMKTLWPNTWQAQKEHIVNSESAGANLAKDLRSLNLSERSKSPDNSPFRRQPNSEYQGFNFITSNNQCLIPERCGRRSRNRLELG